MERASDEHVFREVVDLVPHDEVGHPAVQLVDLFVGFLVELAGLGEAGLQGGEGRVQVGEDLGDGVLFGVRFWQNDRYLS